MCSGTGTRALPRVGFPIRKSPGQRLFSTSPGLIAAVHVLHRLLAPRHPPLALSILILRTPLSLCSFQGSRRRTGKSLSSANRSGRHGQERCERRTPEGPSRLSKLNSVRPFAPRRPRRRGGNGRTSRRRRVSRGQLRRTVRPEGHIATANWRLRSRGLVPPRSLERR